MVLELDDYERDNLLHALLRIGNHLGDNTIPVSRLNTGDWVMQLAYKLGYRGAAETDHGRPNQVWEAHV